MKRLVLTLLAVVCLCGTAGPAFAWGSATHAYLADRLGSARLEPLDAQELYGAMAPDMFQSDIALSMDPLLFTYTHGAPGQEGFMAVWETARGPLQRAFAWGWVGHNEVWGEDSTAHRDGYVIQKATLLDAGFEQLGVWAQAEQQLGFPLALEDRLLFCHLSVEYAGDLVLRGAAPDLGEKVIAAAFLRSRDVPRLLAQALAGANPEDVTRMEDRFRRYMLVYGGALLQDDDFAARLFALDQSRFVAAYLKYKGVSNVDALRPLLQELSLLGITQALPLLGDYPGALETTLVKVQAELAAHGVALPPGSGRELPAPRARALH